ncbi:uncharacterized protein LOC129767164 [Toxorhynchites rutilus septentrionalis]|uniref:uncharacterized protein LOC129767164 n=1 Tax=Toxorhynchites rutilus septentrionalis TaxID=329112 RepID=UPI002479C4C7|nr:uncharacterized protein LOC129767164 [Toxorhynchites rutilus septentrionalis]
MSENTPSHFNQQRGNPGPGFHPEQRFTPRQPGSQAVSRELPFFNGTPEEWPLFYSTFMTTTNLCGYTPEENLIRLQKCLKGKAYDAVKCRLMHPANVSGILSTLKMLFGNPEVIVHNLISKIHSTPAPKVDQLDTIIEFSLAVQNLCATIEACQLEEYSYNVALLHELVDKLPSSFKIEWAKYRRNLPRVHLAAFSKWLYELAEIVCPIASLQLGETKPARSSRKNTAFLNAHNQETSDDPVGKPRQQVTTERPAKTCVVCKGSCSHLENGRMGSSEGVCGKNGCTFKHHQLLHNIQRDGTATSSSNAPGTTAAKVAQNTSVRECNAHHKSANKGLFRVAPVVIHDPSKSIKTFAFLDDGSSLTLVDSSLVQELKLQGETIPLCLKWTGNKRRMENDSMKLDLEISGTGEVQKKYRITGAHTVASLDLFHQTVDMQKLSDQYPYLQGIPIESYKNVQPRLLIGIDNANLTFPLKGREGKMHEPIATKTRLGWIIHGGSETIDALVGYHRHSVQPCPCSEQSDEMLQQAVRDYFSLDSLGVYKSEKRLVSSEEQRAQEILQSLVQTNTGRYEVSLLWKFDKVRLPNSKPTALRRFHCLEARMKKQPELSNVLRAKIEDYLRKGYIRKLSQEELRTSHERVWYLPLFPVFNPNKPGKVRIVWDAAAKTNGVSLNSMLMTGPDLLTPLDYVLYRFREFRVGLSGDVKEMYLQVLMSEKDQHCLRVLWSDDSSGEPDVYVTQVMPFGTCCSPSCAQFVKNLNARRFETKFPAATQAIIKQHYVDDMLVSVETEQEAIQLARDVKFVHAQAGFDMRNWISNSPAVVEAMKEDKTAEKSLNLAVELGTEKILGMWWCTSTDTFIYKLSSKHDRELLEGQRKPTKREVLRTLMAIFDPLGLISNVLIYLKILFREIWRAGIGWDDLIPESLNEKWEKWLDILPKVQNVSIPRGYRSLTQLGPQTNIQLHTFVDASLSGFAAVTYLRFEQGSTVECAIVGAKTRVTPLKFLSIPRLELQAAVIGVRLADRIMKSLSFKVHKRFFWTDSRDVLCWIQSDHRRYSQFVAFRISEILETTEAADWGYKRSKENVADDATKWQGVPDLTENSRWFKGPSFLWEFRSNWPSNPYREDTTDEELRANIFYHQAKPAPMINVEDYSSWKRLLRATATALRAAHNIRQNSENGKRITGPLSAELQQATIYLYRLAQVDAFPDEIGILSAGSEEKTLSKSSSIHKFNPFLDEQKVLRMHGRISACEYASMDARNPIILPRDHHVTWLIFQDFHERYHHQNHSTVINELRQTFRIPRIRRLFQGVRTKCQECKIQRATPRPPPMADLPAARLAAFTRPFSFIGIDYFGPMLVVVGRRPEKRWGVLITCLTIRAVHIEIAHSLSANSCILALRNFMARRGVPIQILSDRGTNFTAASKEIKATYNELEVALKKMDQAEVIREITSPETEWKFLPPASPHMGGSWERLIQSVKRNLTAMKPGRNPTDETLRNMLTEVENVINSRPLTYVPIEDPEAPVLTPNHFLLGSSSGLKPATIFDDSAVVLRRSWCISQVETNIFWKRWVRDYLPDLTKRTKWFDEVKPIEVNDIVVVVDPGLPRNCWPKGRVISVNKSKDGQVRSAAVQTQAGIYERPATKLAILEVRRDEEVSQGSGIPGGDCHDPLVGASHLEI